MTLRTRQHSQPPFAFGSGGGWVLTFGKMKMRRYFIVVVLLLAGCARYPSKDLLQSIMQQHDPLSLTLEPGYNDYVRLAILKDGTEVGIIQLQDGATAKYWFRSHHLVDDMGGTWFQMSDGTTTYMAGWFCCEVQLPEAQFKSLDDLKAFIRKHHGTSP
jgi:hypothetical protein